MPRFVMAAVLAAFSFLCATLVPLLSFAQDRGRQCDPHDLVARMLVETMGHRLVLGFVTQQNFIVEFYGRASGEWTAIVTEPNGCTGIFDFGIGWESYPPPEKPPARKKGA